MRRLRVSHEMKRTMTPEVTEVFALLEKHGPQAFLGVISGHFLCLRQETEDPNEQNFLMMAEEEVDNLHGRLSRLADSLDIPEDLYFRRRT